MPVVEPSEASGGCAFVPPEVPPDLVARMCDFIFSLEDQGFTAEQVVWQFSKALVTVLTMHLGRVPSLPLMMTHVAYCLDGLAEEASMELER